MEVNHCCCERRRRVDRYVASACAAMTSSFTFILLLAGLVDPIYGAPAPLPSEADSPSSDSSNSLGMLFITPRAVGLPRANDSSNDDFNFFIPVVMAESTAPVSTRDPAIIFVRGCRGGYREGPSGICREVVTFPPFPTRPTPRPRRPSSRFPRPRIVPQTQRDLVRGFSRRRNSAFGRSLGSDEKGTSSSSSSSSSFSRNYSSEVPEGGPFVHSTTPAPTTSTTTISTTTPDNDD